jgi:hypothetical protein
MHMPRITPSGEVALVGQRLPTGPSAVAADPDSTDLYIAGGCAVHLPFST